jgi:hypothetical protein
MDFFAVGGQADEDVVGGHGGVRMGMIEFAPIGKWAI